MTVFLLIWLFRASRFTSASLSFLPGTSESFLLITCNYVCFTVLSKCRRSNKSVFSCKQLFSPHNSPQRCSVFCHLSKRWKSCKAVFPSSFNRFTSDSRNYLSRRFNRRLLPPYISWFLVSCRTFHLSAVSFSLSNAIIYRDTSFATSYYHIYIFS